MLPAGSIKKNCLVVSPSRYLKGKVNLPGDKSISHRTLILSSIAKGTSCIEGFQRGKDCVATLRCIKDLGIDVRWKGGKIVIEGRGLRGLREPKDVLNCQNSGTTMRILSGVLAAQDFYSVLTGDSSLRRRPMGRIVLPLRRMGARIWAREGCFAPLSIKGGHLQGKIHNLTVASAQVKSSLLLAGLYAEGVTKVKEPYRSRDHTERMLTYMGAGVSVDDSGISIEGGQELEARDLFVPRDISAGAFFIAAALILKGSRIKIERVGVNPTRCGFIRVLKKMGAGINIHNQKMISGEEVADLEVESEDILEGVRVGGNEVPQLLDEIPVLAVVACFAKGKTLIEGAEELRVKETDRIKAICSELTRMGAKIEERKDGMLIYGVGRLKGAEVNSWGDHRIAMALAVAGLCAEGNTLIKNTRCIDVSFPGFEEILDEVRVN